MSITKLKLAFILSALAFLFSSCNDFKDSNDYTTEEFDKNLDGSWYISKATRNGLEITQLMDFSEFRITFNQDQTYKIDNYLPFLVRKNGKWNTDDPKYPYQLVFAEEGESEDKVSAFEYIIVGGERQMVLTFTPGHPDNVYSYTFERASSN